jgi:hypothetical protein
MGLEITAKIFISLPESQLGFYKKIGTDPLRIEKGPLSSEID